MIPFPDKKYSVIYADPPWSYSGGGAKRNVTRHYHTMKAKDIYDLPVQDIAADDCLLFMWATFPNLEVALETIRRWGFQYKTAAFVWVKRNRKSPWLVLGPGELDQSKPGSLPSGDKGKADPRVPVSPQHNRRPDRTPQRKASGNPRPDRRTCGGRYDRTICQTGGPRLGRLGRRSAADRKRGKP